MTKNFLHIPKLAFSEFRCNTKRYAGNMILGSFIGSTQTIFLFITLWWSEIWPLCTGGCFWCLREKYVAQYSTRTRGYFEIINSWNLLLESWSIWEGPIEIFNSMQQRYLTINHCCESQTLYLTVILCAQPTVFFDSTLPSDWISWDTSEGSICLGCQLEGIEMAPFVFNGVVGVPLIFTFKVRSRVFYRRFHISVYVAWLCGISIYFCSSSTCSLCNDSTCPSFHVL